ncbi:MAG: hypothetical protein K6A72_05935 [Lachnospiraceae bacterium]|nr:hypothetical protein [Lachnospiraceae bacterium]
MTDNEEKNIDPDTSGSPEQVIEDASEEKNHVIVDDLTGKRRLNDKPVEVADPDSADVSAEVRKDEVITDKSGASVGVVFITFTAAAVMLTLMFFLSFRGMDPATKSAVKFTKTVWNCKYDKAEDMVIEAAESLTEPGADAEDQLSEIYSGVYGKLKKVTASKPVHYDNEQGESCAKLYVIVINDSGKAYRTEYVLTETEEGWLINMEATGADGFARIKADGSSDTDGASDDAEGTDEAYDGEAEEDE